MQATKDNRDTIIAIVAEWYTDNDDRLKRAKIKSFYDRPVDLLLSPTQGAIEFIYDKKENIIYIDTEK